MMAPIPDLSAELRCHVCGYDLRAHPPEGRCPECGASVAEARRVAAVPRRPAWAQSDPRWRRRMLAGAWVLVLVPLMDVLRTFQWASSVPVPRVFNYLGTVHTLDDTLASWASVYQAVAFCIGVVLLFSRERGRQRGRLDWTRRWGVLCSYVVLLLSATEVLFLAALVLAGMAAVFKSMPLKGQPAMTPFCSDLSAAYLRYGPQPGNMAAIVLAAFSSIVILLACIPLFDALRSSGPKRIAAILLAPLVLFALLHLGQAGYCVAFSSGPSADVSRYGLYFWPQPLVDNITGHPAVWGIWAPAPVAPGVIVVEAAKWCIMLAVAVWLSIAQLAAWRRARHAGGPMRGQKRQGKGAGEVQPGATAPVRPIPRALGSGTLAGRRAAP
jgi:hypothetical protein